jgi:hypothetical protein
MGVINNLLAHFGIAIENRPAPMPDITKVESAVAISRIFRADCDRQKLDHEIEMRGGPIVPTNDAGLGRDRRSWLGRTISDWLQ